MDVLDTISIQMEIDIIMKEKSSIADAPSRKQVEIRT